MGMDQYLYIPFLVGWTSIYQLFWCSPGVQGFDTLPNGWFGGTSKWRTPWIVRCSALWDPNRRAYISRVDTRNQNMALSKNECGITINSKQFPWGKKGSKGPEDLGVPRTFGSCFSPFAHHVNLHHTVFFDIGQGLCWNSLDFLPTFGVAIRLIFEGRIAVMFVLSHDGS